MRISTQVTGVADIVAMLSGPKIDTALREAVTESTALILNRIRTNFLAQVAPDGSHWEPSYAAFKRSFGLGRMKGKTGGGTLFDTGTLFHSIQLHSISPLEGAISTDVPYAVYHNEGTDKLPKREFLGFSDADSDLALNVFLFKLEGVFK